MTSVETTHRTCLLRLSIAARLATFALLHLASRLPLFDASPILVPGISALELPLLRWDAFHFLHTASHGYVHENEWAFFPGVAYLMRTWGLLQRLAGQAPAHLLLMGMTGALACDTSQLLYALSLHHLRSPELAFLASALSLIPTSPVTAYFAPYNEPFFANFSYRGMLCCARREWAKAALWFATAGLFRSNGILLSGFIVWGLLVGPLLARTMPSLKTTIKAAALTTVVLTPFVGYQAYAYLVFCVQPGNPQAEWCSAFPPSIYSYAQSKYWDVGFLRYWTLNQLPNFLIAAPSIALIFAFSLDHLKYVLSPLSSPAAKSQPLESAFYNASITPHAVHAAIFASILLLASHTQIVLRLAHSMPLMYWAAAWLLVRHPKAARLWIIWSVIWGTISIILWATFLPPA